MLTRGAVALRLALILCLMLTGIGLGVARGTVQIDGQVVLCSGQGIVVTHAAKGHSGGRVHVCPDMALALLAAVALPDLPLAPPATRRGLSVAPWARAVLPAAPPQASARGPPRKA